MNVNENKCLKIVRLKTITIDLTITINLTITIDLTDKKSIKLLEILENEIYKNTLCHFSVLPHKR